MKSPSQLAQFRDDFIKNFRRIDYNSTPGDAQFLRILIEASRAKNGLEIGVATGYGAMVMGLAFERNRGHLTSVDIDGKMVLAARSNIKKMNLQETVTVVKGSALNVIPKLDSSFDFVFIDALKKEYLQYFLLVEPKLKRNAIVVADNVIQHAKEMRDFLETVQDNPKYHSVIIRASDEKDDGMMVLSRKSNTVALAGR
jgi:caffeoyl-CoA O-methyltransferase